jgi:hypothetical protein
MVLNGYCLVAGGIIVDVFVVGSGNLRLTTWLSFLLNTLFITPSISYLHIPPP